MTTQRTGAAETRPLEILGIGEAEERAYRWLLAHPGVSTPEVAGALGLTSNKTQRLLDAIEAKGLVTHSPERPPRYIPAAPDIAIEALALQHHQAVSRAEGLIPELQEQAAARTHNERELMVELITSRAAEHQIVERMTRTAQHEIIALVRPPVLVSRLDLPPEQDELPITQREAMARGVRSRSIVDVDFLDLPGAIARVRGDINAGEEVRVVPRLPFKMVLTDRRIAFLPLNLEQSGSPLLLVRSSALLEALYALFEILWERASPITFSGTGVLETGVPDARLSQEDADLVTLLAAGLNDKKIAYEFGISTRTLNRRLVKITKVLRARTRFQMGWLAALHLADSRRHAAAQNR